MENLGLKLYLLFIVSWLLHLGERIPFFGAIRFDLILIIILTFLAFSKAENSINFETETGKLLRILIAYSVLTIPFVEWPGSVIHTGIPNFIKAIVFYYFTISFVKTERDLKILIFTFIACQSWRILEPLYLHVTEGYWGDRAYMATDEFMDRLAGAPSDPVNPNGLAFVICSVLPFLYFMADLSWKNQLAFISSLPLFLYALALTGSRSGVIGLMIIFSGILVKSKRRLLLALSGIFVVVVGFSYLDPDMQDRYLSIVGKGEKNAATAEERLEGVKGDFIVMLRRPIFGHGLGTSKEANFNFRGSALPSHNLYTEVGQELGLVGLVIFVLFMKSILSNFIQSQTAFRQQNIEGFLCKLVDALQIWLMMIVVFSFASYGLSGYQWYLFAGLSVLIQRLAQENLVSKPAKSQGYSHKRRYPHKMKVKRIGN